VLLGVAQESQPAVPERRLGRHAAYRPVTQLT